MKDKKMRMIVGGVSTIALLFAIGIGLLVTGALTPEPIAYEFIDESAIEDESVKGWIIENKETSGAHTFKPESEDFQYLMIAKGETLSQTLGIMLNSIERKAMGGIAVSYEFINDGNEGAKSRTPKMILRFSTNKELSVEATESSSTPTELPDVETVE